MPQSNVGTSTAMRQLEPSLHTMPGPGTFATRFSARFNVGTSPGQLRQLWPFLGKMAGAQTFTMRPSVRFSFGPTIEMRQLPPTEGGGDNIIVATWEDDLVAQLALQEIPTTRTTLYTVPDDPDARNAIIRFIDLINDTGSPITVSVWIDGTKIVPTWSVPANDVRSRNGIWDIGPSTIIEAQASALGCNISISGVLEIYVPPTP